MEELAKLITLALARNKQLLQEGVKRTNLMSDKPIHYRRVYRSSRTIRKAREDAIETFAAHPIDVSEIRVNCMGRTYFDLFYNHISVGEIRNFFGVLDFSGFAFKEARGVRKNTKDGVTVYLPTHLTHASPDKEDVAVGMLGDLYHHLLDKLNVEYLELGKLLNHDGVTVELAKSMARLDKLKAELLIKKVFTANEQSLKAEALLMIDRRLRLYPYLGASASMPDNLKNVRERHQKLLADKECEADLDDRDLRFDKEAKKARQSQKGWLKALLSILEEEKVL